MSYKCFSRIKRTVVLVFFVSLSASSMAQSTATSKSLSIVYGHKEAKKSKAIYLSDIDGNTRIKVIGATLSDGYPAVSPTGKQIAFYGKYDDFKTWSIHVVDVDGRNMRRLTHKQHVWDSAPAWSPDGKTIVFAREYKDETGTMKEEIWLMNADGTDKRQIETLEGRSPEFMPDGRLLFQSKAGPSQICIANVDGSNLIQLTNDDTNNMSPKLSPDGTQIAYLANRDGNQEVYVMNVDGTNHKRLTRNRVQEWDPAWSPDGSRVFFSSQNVYGFYDIYKVNRDGSSIEKVLNSGSQAGTVHHLDENYVKRLLKSQ